jgi:hypothetical protein
MASVDRVCSLSEKKSDRKGVITYAVQKGTKTTKFAMTAKLDPCSLSKERGSLAPRRKSEQEFAHYKDLNYVSITNAGDKPKACSYVPGVSPRPVRG